MLKGKLVVITGGATGIGYAVSRELLKNHATVITTSRNFEFHNNKIIHNAINNQYLDVTSQTSIDQFFVWVSQQDIKMEVLINNAGVGIFKSFVEITPDEVNTVITTNLTGAFLCSQKAFLLMQLSGGRIINIGSIVELAGVCDNSVYAASKSGLKGLSLVISEEGSRHNITSTHITLGAIYSDIWKYRPDFNKNSMLDISHVANIVKNIVELPYDVRIDTLEVTPKTKII